MQCSVIGCSNQSNKSECRGIVFYPLPIDPPLREKWIKILDTRKVKRRVYACSSHFSEDDFLPSGNMREDAVPVLVQACRICLAVGTKLYDMIARDLSQAYEEVTGLMACNSNQLPHKLCWECAHRVMCSQRLRTKARRSYDLMMELVESQHYITTDSITSIDRVENNLISTLSHYYNLYDLTMVVEEDEIDTQKDETTDIYLDIDLKSDDENIDPKSEDEVFLDEIYHSDDDRSTSTELFTQENHIIVKSDEIGNVKPMESEKSKMKDIEPKTVTTMKLPDINLEIFEVTYLSIEEQHREIEKRKEAVNFKKARLKCLLCYKAFSEVDSHASHMMKHSDKAGTFGCDICKIRFKARNRLRSHMKTHREKFTCKLCPYVTMRRNVAKSHEKYHQGTVYSCLHCQEQFTKVTTYMGHLRIKHPSDFVCELCGNSFVNERGVVMHKKLKHRFDDITVPPDGPRCEPCDIRFQTIEALNKHLLLSPKHPDKKPSMVQRATRGPGKPKNPDEYINEEPISCEQCDEKLPNAFLYYHHFRRAHPDKNRTYFPTTGSHRVMSMCEVCGKMFQSTAALADHSHTHMAKPQFSCEQCHKKFQRKANLMEHLKLHAAVRKTYECPECGKRFTSKFNMMRHTFTHSSKKAFNCEMCGKAFQSVYHKKHHIAHVHMKKPWPKKRSREARRKVLQTQEDSDDGSTSDVASP